MRRLTEKDIQGNWRLKDVPWERLHVGQTITEELWQKLYGALWKLMEYEDTGLSPDDVEEVNKFEGSNGQKYLLEIAKHRWIPVSEQLPEVPERTEDDYCPEFNVTINGADKATTLKCAPDGTWFDDFGEVYNVTAWQPLPEPYKGV